MSQTPRTDAQIPDPDFHPATDDWVNADFARQLERELAQAKTAWAQWEKLAKQRGEGQVKLLVEKADLEAEVAALREDKARLDWLEVQYQRERKSFSNASVATGGESWPDEITLMVHAEDGTVTFVEGTTFRDAIDAARKINS